MAYKLLGVAVWRGARWYVRRRYGGTARKAAAGGTVAAALVGGLVAQRRSARS